MKFDGSLIKVGDIVTPRTKAGLELAVVPTTGDYGQRREFAFVLRGEAMVVAVYDVVIDYDTWPGYEDPPLGKVPYRNCLVEAPDGRQGWAGSGALEVVTSPAK